MRFWFVCEMALTGGYWEGDHGLSLLHCFLFSQSSDKEKVDQLQEELVRTQV